LFREREKKKRHGKTVLKERSTVNSSLAQAECNFLALILDILSNKSVLLNLVKNKSSYNIFISPGIPEAIVCFLP